MKGLGTFKADRVLCIYMRLLKGEFLHQKALAQEYHVTARSIQRDISVLRFVLAEQHMGQEIISGSNGYRLQHAPAELPGNQQNPYGQPSRTEG